MINTTKQVGESIPQKKGNYTVEFVTIQHLSNSIWQMNLYLLKKQIGETIKPLKLLVQIPLRELHNESIKISSEGGFSGA